MNKAEVFNEESSSCRRGRHHGRRIGRGRGHGRGRNPPTDEDKEKKSFDKSTIQCYSCKKYGHFAYECRSGKKKQDDRAYVTQSTLARAPVNSSMLAVVATSSLLMVVVEEASDLLLHGSEGALFDPIV